MTSSGRENTTNSTVPSAVGEALESVLAKLGSGFGASGEIRSNGARSTDSEDSDDVSTPTVTTVYQPGYRLGERIWAGPRRRRWHLITQRSRFKK